MNLQDQLIKLNKALDTIKSDIEKDTSIVEDIKADISEIQAKIALLPDWPRVYKANFHDEGPVLESSVLTGTTQELALIEHGLASDEKQEVINSLGLLRYINKNADTSAVNQLLNTLNKSTMPMIAVAMLLDIIIDVNEDIRLLNGVMIINQADIDSAELASIDDESVVIPEPVMGDWKAGKDDTKYYLAIEYFGDDISVGSIKNSWQYHYNPIRTSEVANQIIDKYGAKLKAFSAY